jgi:hypothetical protein
MGSGVYQFGPFDLNAQTGELRKQGIRVRLQPKPLQILIRLIETPGSTGPESEQIRKARLLLLIYLPDTRLLAGSSSNISPRMKMR